MHNSILILFAVSACGSDTTSLFDLTEEQGFYANPFPGDHRLTDDGHIDLSGHGSPSILVDAYLDVIATRQRGFSPNGGIFFRFDNTINIESLPQTLAASVADDASAYIVNVDKNSPNYGQRVPSHTRFREDSQTMIGSLSLAIKPFPGFPLDSNTTYAAVVTDRVKGGSGGLRAAETFTTMLQTTAPSEAIAARAYQAYAPLRDFLADNDDNVVVASVFTTGDPTELSQKLREVVHALDAPEFGNVTTAGDAPVEWYDAEIEMPIFQAGKIPYSDPEDGGDIKLDDEGKPILQRMETTRISVTFPIGKTMPTNGWPVAIYSHGTGGSYHTFVNNESAARFSQSGIAMISIDQVLHGPRGVGNEDLNFFNFANPLSARDNVLQGVVDNFVLTRLVREQTITTPGQVEHKFDPDKVYFVGHSQGSLVGVPFVGSEPDIKAAVFSGAGGLLYLTTLYKTKPFDITAIIGAFLGDQQADEFHPGLSLLQGWVDPSDAISYAAAVTTEQNPRDVLLVEGLGDSFTPNQTTSALATAMAIDHIEPVLEKIPGLGQRGVQSTSSPVDSNCRFNTTCGLVQYRAMGNADGHFVLFDVSNAWFRAVRFLGSKADSGTAEIAEHF